MGTVIGYTGTSEDRRMNWLSMLTFKKSHELHRHVNDEWHTEIAEKNKRNFDKFLTDYVGKEAA